MPIFSNTSKKRLATCHPDLITLCNECIQIVDFTVLCGHRGEKEQNEAFERGNSTLQYPKSKHNSMPSMAVDLAPWPINWKDIKGFIDFGNFVMKQADRLYKEGRISHRVEWGGGWVSFVDYPHFQLR